MTKWEYLVLRIGGHNESLNNESLNKAQNMLVTTSDGRWRQERMPKDVFGIVRQLGGEGWEMVSCSNVGKTYYGVWPSPDFEAVFKRPR